MSPPTQAILDAAAALRYEPQFTARVHDRRETRYRFEATRDGRVKYRRMDSETWHCTTFSIPRHGPTRAQTFTSERPSPRPPHLGRATTMPAASPREPSPFDDLDNLEEAFEELRTGEPRDASPRPQFSGRFFPEPDPVRPRMRRANSFEGATASRPDERNRRRSTGAPPRSAEATSPPTYAERQAAGIPPGYSVENWRPGELALTVLGSAFAPDALGRWLHDWAIHERHPQARTAEALKGLLTGVAARLKVAEGRLPELRDPDARELFQDFITSARQRVLGVDREPTDGGSDLRSLLKECDRPAQRAMDRRPDLPTAAGEAFIAAFLGDVSRFERVEALVDKLWTWRVRFDANCEPLL